MLYIIYRYSAHHWFYNVT